MKVSFVQTQIKDRIPYHLSGTVISYVSPAIDPENLRSTLFQFFFRRKEVILVCPFAERIDVLMLREDQNVPDDSEMPQIKQLSLKLPCVCVAGSAYIGYGDIHQMCTETP
jgi:hypothetical protein